MYKFVKEKLNQSEFLRNVSFLISGTLIAQLISILSSPVLARLYSPADFGIFASFMTIVGIISTFCTLKYDLAIVKEKLNKRSQQVQVLSYYILMFFSVLFFLFILFTPISILELLNLNYGQYAYILVPLLLLTGLYSIQSYVLTRSKKFKLISSAGVILKIGIVFFQFIFWFIFGDYLGLIYGNLIGLFLSILFLYIYSANEFISLNLFSHRQLFFAAKKHYRFPVFSAPQSFMNTLSQQLPIYFLGFYYGAEIIGMYWMAMRIVQLPTLLIGNSIRQVYFQKANELSVSMVDASKIFNKTTINLLLLSIVPTLILFLYSEGLFIFILGREWSLAGEFAGWMAIWIGVGFITSPTMMSLIIYNKQKINMYYDLLLLIARFVVLTFGGINLDPIETIILYSIVGSVFNLSIVVFVKFQIIEKEESYV